MSATRPIRGMHKDNDILDQPEGSYLFALNAVNKSTSGDRTVRTNELSNTQVASLPTGYLPIGSVYTTNDEIVIFSHNPELTRDEIGILSAQDQYSTLVNAELNFSIANQIDAVYRLRRGCERMIYWVDGRNVPRRYNIDAPQDFKTAGGDWDITSFSLISSYNDLPRINSVEIIEAGTLAAGSYNIALQYLDDDLNPTEWITASDTIIIYHDNPVNQPFSSLRGSTNEISQYREYGLTNKAIRFTFINFDFTYPYYRIALIEATTGNGEVSKVSFTSEISIGQDSFTLTGSNTLTEGTTEEIAQVRNYITKANHIDQVDNKLILANTQGIPIPFHRLQKYASKIHADVALQEIILNDATQTNNPKRGTVHEELVGYMPGELYAFNIHYIFEDGIVSPDMHIPGRAEGSPGKMSLNNQLSNTFYQERDNCTVEAFWGYDFMGQPLTDASVRHHRFPLRSEINEPLVSSEGDSSFINVFQLVVNVEGTVSDAYAQDTVDYIVTYAVNDSQFTVQKTLNLIGYDPANGIQQILITENINLITLVSIQELDAQDQPVNPSTNTGLVYTAEVTSYNSQTDDKVYRSKIMGVKFSNIEIPSLEDTGGYRPIGYYITRAERGREDKTILDSGFFSTLIEEKRDGISKFVAHGHLIPDTPDKKTDIFALIHPEHKFNDQEYTGAVEYLKEGEFTILNQNIADNIIQDVQPGTSYDATNNQRRERDSDGFDLHVMTRSTEVSYNNNVTDTFLSTEEIKEVFYLDALYAKSVDDSQDVRKEVYNVAADNKTGFVVTTVDKISEFNNKFPYVVIRRNLSDPYSDFTSRPFFRETSNPFFFTEDVNEATVFNGDSYISPLNYTSSMFYDIRVRSRRTKTGVLNFIIGGLATIAGAVLIATGVGVALGIAVIGLGVAAISSGLKKEQISRVYQEKYEQGLKDTVQDADTETIFGPNPPDDEIQHFFDNIYGLWLESSVNMGWRMGNTLGLTDFLDAPGQYNENNLLTYAVEKVTILDATADGGRAYQGYTKAELYDINADYYRRNRQKFYYLLPTQYDGCSKCLEEFPHRVHASEESFQEELTDNYRMFLPNNYIDIPGESGKITDLFTIQNNLYIHTEEGLWHLPYNVQERVTGDIVSFLGTGDYFGIPPRTIVDDRNGNSAGTRHKWATLKTPYGVFFVCEHQSTVFQFDGNKLIPISEQDLEQWFEEKLPINYDAEYEGETDARYPFSNNPSNPFGTGFISTYDTRFNRAIFTKKDFSYNTELIPDSDYRLCSNGQNLLLFENYSTIIAQREALGQIYRGIENCRMKFEVLAEEIVTVINETTISNSTDIHVFFDTSGSFGNMQGACLQSIDNAIESWLANFAAANPDWEGSVYKYVDSSERWLRYPKVISNTTYAGQDTTQKDILVISFCNETAAAYHSNNYNNSISAPSTSFNADYGEFVNSVYPAYNKFIGIHYPIVFGENSGSCFGSPDGELFSSKEFLMHSIAALYGTTLTSAQLAAILPGRNAGFTEGEWAQMLNSLETNNPYPDDGLINYGWVGKWDRSADSFGNVINSTQFNTDISTLLQGTTTVTETTTEVQSSDIEYVDGTVINIEETYNLGWTISYDIEQKSWISMHSYIPNFYLHTASKFFSFQAGTIYRHNIPDSFQNFYGTRYPYIMELVFLSEGLANTIWDQITVLTLAEKASNGEYVEVDGVSFSKAILYNNRQCSGLLDLDNRGRNEVEVDYMLSSITAGNQVLFSNHEDLWHLNNFRDIRTDYSLPIFTSLAQDLQEEYYIDKVLVANSLDVDKPWQEKAPFRGKHLVVRLIFNTFDDVKLSLTFGAFTKKSSYR